MVLNHTVRPRRTPAVAVAAWYILMGTWDAQMNPEECHLMAVLVDSRGVTYQIGGRDMLHGIDLCVEESETVALLGRSASGKTTLLKMVNRLVDTTGGEGRFEGTAPA